MFSQNKYLIFKKYENLESILPLIEINEYLKAYYNIIR